MPRPAAEAVTSQARRSPAHAQIIRIITANYEKQQLLTWCNICVDIHFQFVNYSQPTSQNACE